MYFFLHVSMDLPAWAFILIYSRFQQSIYSLLFLVYVWFHRIQVILLAFGSREHSCSSWFYIPNLYFILYLSNDNGNFNVQKCSIFFIKKNNNTQILLFSFQLSFMIKGSRSKNISVLSSNKYDLLFLTIPLSHIDRWNMHTLCNIHPLPQRLQHSPGIHSTISNFHQRDVQWVKQCWRVIQVSTLFWLENSFDFLRN